MAVTIGDFRLRFPELDKAPQQIVTRCLATANNWVNPDIWGGVSDDGVAYLAAHYVAMSPGGEHARLDPKAVKGDDPLSTTIYGVNFLAMRNAIAVGPCVIS